MRGREGDSSAPPDGWHFLSRGGEGGGGWRASGKASGGCGWPASDSRAVTVRFLARGAQRETLLERRRRQDSGADLLRQAGEGWRSVGGSPGRRHQPSASGRPPVSPAPRLRSSTPAAKRLSALPALLAGWLAAGWLLPPLARSLPPPPPGLGLDGAVHQCGAEMARGASLGCCGSPCPPKVVGRRSLRPREQRRRGWRAGGSGPH